jgi:hypothetical protein
VRDTNGPTEPRTSRILGDRAAEVREADSRCERKPRQRFVLVFQKQRFQITRCDLALREGESRTVVGDETDGFIVVLPERCSTRSVCSCRGLVT